VRAPSTWGPPPVETWPPRACEGRDYRLWFPDGTGLAAIRQRTQAKRICHTCLAKPDCAAFALPIKELRGIWAETTEYERARERKRQKKEA